MTTETKSIVLISKDSKPFPEIGAALKADQQYNYEECSGTLTEMNGRASVLADTHDLILFQTETDTEIDVLAIKRLREANGEKAVILALSGAETTLADAQLLTRAGVDGVLAETISPDELEAEISKRLKPKIQLPALMPDQGTLGKVITIAQARGGIGATMLAVNFADHLLGKVRRKQDKPDCRVALVDLDLQFGSISSFLDAKPNEALYQLSMDGTEPDATFLSQSMEHFPNGLSVLAAPSKLAPLDALKPQQVSKLLQVLQHEYDYVVVDLPHALVEWLAPVLEATDRMLLVLDSTVPAVQKARQLIDFYTEDNLTLQIDLVVSHEKKPLIQGRHHTEAAKALERPLRHWLPPHPKAAREAVDRGVPLSKAARSSSLNKAVKRLVTTIKAELAQAPHSAQQVQ
ncbi:Septum site-determining protein MinD [Roseovarius albus]|uniref:Septum site-determining protein MinD n=1 Tax=Roseovarius albus TaxID=1247867 RepID=A0A1X7A983_9RHOB|nr:AAA family ATPase [Roseovarius albus]SLN73327.1 Septum site-determining protein MinD [Roseovarius albus]